MPKMGTKFPHLLDCDTNSMWWSLSRTVPGTVSFPKFRLTLFFSVWVPEPQICPQPAYLSSSQRKCDKRLKAKSISVVRLLLHSLSAIAPALGLWEGVHSRLDPTHPPSQTSSRQRDVNDTLFNGNSKAGARIQFQGSAPPSLEPSSLACSQ